jgi:hypothetical protein
MFDNLFKVATTVVTTAISTANPLAGIAIQQISTVLVQKSDASIEEIEKAIEKASPEQLLRIEGIEKKFQGIKETTELIECINMIGVFIAKNLKQGMPVDTSLFVKLQKDPEFQAALNKASEGINKIHAEINDLDFEENISLGVLGLRYISQLLTVLNNKES